ncbi:unnamed protein product [Linum trigynum]|uniref:Uncharacterized protein n=1 Tax=Linum trigynum TaxID=586398 RepID=A0AAV2ETV9_9ROSI
MSSSKLSNLSWAELRDRARRIGRRWSSEESPTVQAETVTQIADGERPPTSAEADEAVEVTVGGSDTELAMKEKGGDIASSWAIQEPSWVIRSTIAKGEDASWSLAAAVAATGTRQVVVSPSGMEEKKIPPEPRLGKQELRTATSSGQPACHRLGGSPPGDDSAMESSRPPCRRT